MKKFKFRMQKLLEIREDLEKREKLAFSKVLMDYTDTENLMKNYQKNKKEQLLNSRKILETNNINLLILRDNARAGLSNRIKLKTKELELKKPKLERARELLLDAVKNKKVIEILKNKAEAKYYKELQRLEQNELDEIGTNSFIMKKNNEQ